jgi:DNA-binding transcriptional ArsR family regulator
MDSGNRLGDLEITDPKTMRALAHPVRLAILERLQRHGPATATQLAPDVGATPSVTSWHLRHLAGFGLVRDAKSGPDRRQRRWEAVARGFRFEVPADPADEEGRSAARVLSREMFLRSADLPHRWVAEAEPGLDPVFVTACPGRLSVGGAPAGLRPAARLAALAAFGAPGTAPWALAGRLAGCGFPPCAARVGTLGFRLCRG